MKVWSALTLLSCFQGRQCAIRVNQVMLTSQSAVYMYNPPNNFCGLLLGKTDQVIQNWTMVITGYPPSDLISLV